MHYDIEEQEIIVRLNNDEGINENDIFINSFESKLCEVQWVADSLYYLSPMEEKDEFDDDEISELCKQLDEIIDIIDEEYWDFWGYSDEEEECTA